ncbi:hypothetical protein Tsubulata_006090, partial [Turnera subulata]
MDYHSHSSSISNSTSSGTTALDQHQQPSVKFTYTRASPSVRWPHLKLSDIYLPSPPPPPPAPSSVVNPHVTDEEASNLIQEEGEKEEVEMQSGTELESEEERLRRRSRTQVKKMNKLALRRAQDWRERVGHVAQRILSLKGEGVSVEDVLADYSGRVHLTPTDYCFLVKHIGQENWERALQLYRWVNSCPWYSPNPRMVSAILAVLGKARRESLAAEIFARATLDTAVATTVQVYNAMMGVYARSANFRKVQQVFDLMRERRCEPDLVSFNTLINARFKAPGDADPITPDFASRLLDDVRKSGLSPDIITYNTLISACSRASNLEEAVKVFQDMEAHHCQPDLWTYNTMISVYGRCGLAAQAEQLFEQLEAKGFSPDAITYNSLLYAFARQGDVDKVKEIGDRMVSMGFARNEMTYNTIIDMYGKQGQHSLALQLYRDMKSSSGFNPDEVTYTILIDCLGKANKMAEAASVMSEMLAAGVRPALRTYSALICGYAKAGNSVEAERAFDCMRGSGIIPDRRAYSVMVDIFLRANESVKALRLYREMVHGGITPDLGLYQGILQKLGYENKMEDIEIIVRDMEELCGMKPEAISSILVKGKCYDGAAKMLRKAISNSSEIDHKVLLPILSSFSSSGRHTEALDLLQFFKQHAQGSNQIVTEALITVLCKTHRLDDALREYNNTQKFLSSGSCTMYESLIECCERDELVTEASQIFSDMRFYGLRPSESAYQSMAHLFCKIGFPETAHHLIDLARTEGTVLSDVSILVDVIENYGKLNLWKKAEAMVSDLRQTHTTLDRKVWNALIKAYAASGCYEQARAVFNKMMRDGPFPTLDSVNGLLQALIADGRLDELYVLIQELQDMGFKISKCSITLMIEAFARTGNIFEVKKLYHGMRAAGYLPTMHLYRVRDAEAMVSEMEETGFKPDISIWNSMLRLYVAIEDYGKSTQIYQRIKEDGLEADEDTYNSIIVLFCKDYRPEEGMSMMHEMRRHGLEPKLDTYKSLIAALGKQHLVELAETLFEDLLSKGFKLDRSFYHLMMKFFRNSGDHSKAQNLLGMMKDAGVEPTAATMHLLMVSYGSSGKPEEAAKVLSDLKETGVNLSTLPYSSVIDAYLRAGDYSAGIQKLIEMQKEGVVPDYRIWTCFIRAASLCRQTSEAITLLTSLQDVGFNLPIRLLMEKSESLISDVNQCLEVLETKEDDAAFNFVNALEDLLWAFELRATASWIFQLAIKRKIYRHDIFKVADKDWRADFRKLSGGAALDASLEGYPESPKFVVLVTGMAEYNMVSLNGTLRACLLEMGSPFLPCRKRSGWLVAKAHSLRMWLKDSPFCLDLELKNASSLPVCNSMQLIEGCFIRSDLVPAYKEITEKLGFVRPQMFAKLALLSDEKRELAIRTYIEHGRAKEERIKSMYALKRKKK